MIKRLIRKKQYYLDNMKYIKNLKLRIQKLENDKHSFGLNETVRDEEIIVSLTSYPSRFSELHLVIKSILTQTMKPDKFILYLDDNVTDTQIPGSLSELEAYGLQILFRPGNMKPHKKYYYAIKEHTESIVITIDDDLIYPDNLVEMLFKAHKEYPDCVVAARSHRILFAEDGSIKKYNDWEWTSDLVYKPSFQLIATGAGGVLYPPHCLDGHVLDLELIQKLSLNADDIWLKIKQIMHHTAVVNIHQSVRKSRLLVPGSQTETLNSVNVHNNMNDIYLKNLITYFGLGKEDFMD